MPEKLIEKYVPENKREEALKRLKNNEPIQYIIGNVDFCGYKIEVNKNVLIPRFETEELVENTIKYLKKLDNKKIKILEIGTGSGCISIALKKFLKNSQITATDISKEAIKIAKKNAKNNNVEIDFVHTDLYKGIKDKYDLIISNPPYISKNEKIMDIVYNNEPHLALFADNNGLYYYEEILKNIHKILNKKFLIAFEIGASQKEEIINIVNKYMKNVKIEVKKDLQHRDRMVFISNFE